MTFPTSMNPEKVVSVGGWEITPKDVREVLSTKANPFGFHEKAMAIWKSLMDGEHEEAARNPNRIRLRPATIEGCAEHEART